MERKARNIAVSAKERAIEIACKRLSERALKVLEQAMDEKKTPGLDYRLRIMAAQEILSRAWGKPKQATEAQINIEGGDALIDALKAARIRAGLPGETKVGDIVETLTKLN